MRKFVKWWLPVIAWMIVIFIGSSIGNVPRVGDKATDGVVHRAAHVLEFAILGALLLRAIGKNNPITKRDAIVTLIGVALYGMSDEFHQRYTPGRSSEGLSVLFDVAGGAFGMWIYRHWTMRQQIVQRTARVDAKPVESTGETVSERAFD